MRIAITGAHGQLGSLMVAQLRHTHEVIALDRTNFDLGGSDVAAQIAATNAELVLHPAAYTNVDGCARDPTLAYRINALGTRQVAVGCRRIGAAMLYISTNEVFSGTSDRPYREYDPVGPVNAYGQSKLAGELAVRELLDRFYIVRVAWLFGGARNFIRTILRLAANPPVGGLRMVADEIGSPTHAGDVAAAVAKLITTDQYGTYHFVNQGACSRYEFAAEVLAAAAIRELELTPIALAEYQRDSTPPPYTPLENGAGVQIGISFRSWQAATHAFVAQVRAETETTPAP